MDIRFLNTFVEVAKTKHFGRAAENLYLTQSAVSARIKLLEEYFNCPLFIRERHSIRLSSAGQKLLPFAEAIVLKLNDARKTLEEVDVQHLSIACTPNAWPVLFNKLMQSTNKQFPHLSLQSEVLSTEQLSRQLLERTVDIAFSLETLKSDDITTIKLGEIPLRYYRTVETPVDQALDHFIHTNWDGKVINEFLSKNPQCRHAKFKTASMSLAIDTLQLKEFGSLILPENVAAPLIQKKRIVEVENIISPMMQSVYVSCMKSTQQTSMEEYFNFFASPGNYGDLLE
jgi:DNA-binding transcriptional LysR family regulator